MANKKFDLSLRIYSRSLPATAICSQLGLAPKWMNVMGEPRKTPKGTVLEGVYDRNYCVFGYELSPDEGLHEAIGRITRELEPHKQLFTTISKGGGRSEFFVGWYSSINSGDTFAWDLLQRLAELRIDIALDVYGAA